MAGAVAAAHAVGEGQTVLAYPHGMSYVNGGLVGRRNLTDGSRGTHLAATAALRSAVAALERHLGLHEIAEARGGTQHVVGTGRHTQLTGGAVATHISVRDGARRGDTCLAFGRLLVLDNRQTAVNLHLGLCHGRRGCEHPRCGEESASAGVGGGGGLLSRFALFPFRQREMQCVELAFVQTVAAHHATAVVHVAGAEIDSRSLAVFLAQAALLAFALVQTYFQQRETGQETEGGAHRTHGVAVGASVT